MSLQPAIITEPHDINKRLHELGLTLQEVQEIVDRMVDARNSCTRNHPPGAGGSMAYLEGTCRMREIGAEKGWIRCEERNICSTFNEEAQTKFVVCSTDEGTGLVDNVPQTRNKKGAATSWLLNHPVLDLIFDDAPSKSAIEYWYLCVFHEGEVVRCELVRPSSMEDGHFSGFYERIILPIENSGGTFKIPDETPLVDPSVDVVVSRKVN